MPDPSSRVDSVSDPCPGGAGCAHRRRDAATEVVVGSLLVLAMAVGGVYVACRPASGAVDGWFLTVIGASNSPILTAATSLRYPVVIIVGSLVASGFAFRQGWPRAVACLIGPPLALFLCEALVKPWVGRTLGGALSYPSGTAVGAAALATAAVLATPSRWRLVTVASETAYVLWVFTAVIALRLHYPTDVVAGVAFGVGVVLLADGLARLVAGLVRPGAITIPTAVGGEDAPTPGHG